VYVFGKAFEGEVAEGTGWAVVYGGVQWFCFDCGGCIRGERRIKWFRF
jgi:hypothetical protein